MTVNGAGPERYDVIVVGAGLSGMYALHRFRGFGLHVRVFEAGGDVGGTWYWNRYPGARFDSESWTYGYSFDKEILQEWDWSEHFAPQPETLRYCNFVADRLDLRRDITFDAVVAAAQWDEQALEWEVSIAGGRQARARFLITAVGPLSAPTMPLIEGIDSFEGEGYHTARWPHRPVSFEGKRVAVIGTGATGVQAITEIAKTCGTLAVFQRTPNWCAPLHNSPISPEEMQQIKDRYDEIFATCRETFGHFIHRADQRSVFEVSDEEREAFFEQKYNEPGFGIWMGNFWNLMVDPRANALITDFIARKILQRVKDPAIAEKLIPKNHGFGTRRVPLESGYYEVFNQDNVTLIDVNEEPIERITPRGIKTSAREYEFDLIVYATGFDAITGAFDRIDIRGAGGQTLRDTWADGPQTYLGLMVNGFPNLLTLIGPHNAALFCNLPRCIEQNVDWAAGLLSYARAHGVRRIEATPEAQAEWTAHVHEMGSFLLLSQVDSWMTGINKNVPWRAKRQVMAYAGGAPRYRLKCEEVAASGYTGIEFR